MGQDPFQITIQVSCLSFPAWMTPRFLMLGFWEDGPTLTFFSYWAFSPDSKYLPWSRCPCAARACWAALPHLPLETTLGPPGPCMVHLPCDRHPHCVQAVDPRSPSPFQWLSTKELKLLCTESNLLEGLNLTAGTGFPEERSTIADLIFHF